MELHLAYDVERDAIIVKSMVCDQYFAFSSDLIGDFIEWLKTDRHATSDWNHFTFCYRLSTREFVVQSREDPMEITDFLVFDEAEYLQQVQAVAHAITDLRDDILIPVHRLRAEGYTDDDALLRELDRRKLMELPALWERPAG